MTNEPTVKVAKNRKRVVRRKLFLTKSNIIQLKLILIQDILYQTLGDPSWDLM